MQNQLYVERLYPSLGMITVYLLAFPMVLLAAAPFGWTLAIALAFVATATIVTIAVVISPLLVVDENRLLAGHIAIPLDALGRAEPLTGDSLRIELGPKLDARSQRVIRGEIRSALKIEVRDANDPTPYLLISTRNPSELASALLANRA